MMLAIPELDWWLNLLYAIGLIAGLGGIAIALLWVFADRHHYERPVDARILIALFVVAFLSFVTWWLITNLLT